MCTGDEGSQMELAITLERDEKHIIISHIHGVYRRSRRDGAEQHKVVKVPGADCSIVRTGHQDVSVLDNLHSCYWAAVMI